MNNFNFEFESSAMEVKAGAFDIIAKYVHETYDDVDVSNVTPDEAFFCAVVKTTEQLLGYFRPTEKF